MCVVDVAGRGHNGRVPISFVRYAAETAFVAYAHYLDDIASVVGGRFGRGVEGIYVSMRMHPPVLALPVRSLPADAMQRVYESLAQAWTALALVDNAIDPDNYDRQANAVVPGLVRNAVTAAARALAMTLDAGEPADTEDALTFLGDVCIEELFPYPWSAYCTGCPQLGTAEWGGSVLPGDPVSVFAVPNPATSDARLAMLLRTTRQRILDRHFAIARQTDVRPGRSRRNLSAEMKEEVAAAVAPTTVFDVLDRLARRVESDDGEAFVLGPFDDEEALEFATSVAAVGDAAVAAVESVVAALVGWDVFADLLAGWNRRAPSPAGARRVAAAAGVS